MLQPPPETAGLWTTVYKTFQDLRVCNSHQCAEAWQLGTKGLACLWVQPAEPGHTGDPQPLRCHFHGSQHRSYHLAPAKRSQQRGGCGCLLKAQEDCLLTVGDMGGTQPWEYSAHGAYLLTVPVPSSTTATSTHSSRFSWVFDQASSHPITFYPHNLLSSKFENSP